MHPTRDGHRERLINRREHARMLHGRMHAFLPSCVRTPACLPMHVPPEIGVWEVLCHSLLLSRPQALDTSLKHVLWMRPMNTWTCSWGVGRVGETSGRRYEHLILQIEQIITPVGCWSYLNCRFEPAEPIRSTTSIDRVNHWLQSGSGSGSGS